MSSPEIPRLPTSISEAIRTVTEVWPAQALPPGAATRLDRPTILAQVAALARLDRDGMHAKWRELFSTEPPGYGPDLMRRRLAYRIQELAYGGIAEETKQRLREIDRIARERKAAAAQDPRRPIAGTRLMKEHDGECHEVIVLTKGYQYRGQRFDSLSQIARHITGTNWNGWRFFGLRPQPASAGAKQGAA